MRIILAGGQNMQTKCLPGKGISLAQKEAPDFRIDPGFIAATTVIGDKVKDRNGKELGKIEDIMLDLTSGNILYLVLSTGGVLGIGDRFFALPLEVLTFDREERIFLLDIDKETLKKRKGFDKNAWPRTAGWPP